MSNINSNDHHPDQPEEKTTPHAQSPGQAPERGEHSSQAQTQDPAHVHGARGTAAMDPETRKQVARKGGLAVSRNREHMAEIGRRGGQSVSKNREHMAQIGRKGGAASRSGGNT